MNPFIHMKIQHPEATGHALYCVCVSLVNLLSKSKNSTLSKFLVAYITTE